MAPTVLERPLARGQEPLQFTWAIEIVDDETELKLDQGAKRVTIPFEAVDGEQLIARAKWYIGQKKSQTDVILEQGEHDIRVHQYSGYVLVPRSDEPSPASANQSEIEEIEEQATFCQIM